MSKTVSYSDAREHFKEYLDYVSINSDPIIITRKNGADVVMMARSDYSSLEETLYLMSNKNNRKHLLAAIKQEGKGKKIILKSKKDINNLFANAEI